MNNKKILIISAVYPPEPVVSARLAYDLYKSLKETGLDVSVLHPRPTRPHGFDFGGKIEHGKDEVITDSYVCPQSSTIGRMQESCSFGRSCAKYIRENHSDISCIYANAWPMFSQRAIVKAARKYNIPCVIHVQDVYPDSLSNKLPGILKAFVQTLFLPLDKYILGNCNKVIAISEKMRDYLAQSRKINPNKISIVINWQDEKEFLDYREHNTAKSLDKFTFMYMGNIGPVAGVDLLIDAFNLANIEHARLVIAGSGSMKEKLIEKSASNNNIEFWDVPNGKVPEIQAKADCMLLPIKKGAASSSIPSKLPAYMFSAKPIIGCVDADSDTADAINNANCGWVIDPENPELLSDTMKKVSSLSATILNDKSEKSLGYGLAHFSKKENLRKLVSIIENVL